MDSVFSSNAAHSVWLYCFLELFVIVAFCIFISDRRRKPGMEPLVNPRATLILKLCYPAPILVWIYTLTILNRVTTVDWLALVFVSLGAFLVIKAKCDLGSKHTWTGYHLPGATRITRGLYGYIKHPMYTGIITVIVAGMMVLIPRLPFWLIMVTSLLNIYNVGFLVAAARRESTQ